MKTRRSKAKPKFRAVFDTNVYVAKALSINPRSPNIELFELLKADAYILIWCREIRAEVAEKLLARKLTAERIAEFIAEIMSLVLWVEVPASAIRRYVEDDPDDDVIVACAVVANASHIVSYDQHLLNLKKPFPGCIVLNSLAELIFPQREMIRQHLLVDRLVIDDQDAELAVCLSRELGMWSGEWRVRNWKFGMGRGDQVDHFSTVPFTLHS